MIFTDQDYGQLQKLMDESPENRALLQKLLDSQHYTLSKVTHEIRNPLALISSTVQLIESSHPEAASFRHWDSLKEDIEYMTRLLAELSSYNNGDRLNPVRFSSYDFQPYLSLFRSLLRKPGYGIYFLSLPFPSGNNRGPGQTPGGISQSAEKCIGITLTRRLRPSGGPGRKGLYCCQNR